MEYQTRRRRLVRTLVIVVAVLVLFSLLAAFDFGGSRTGLMALWAGLNSQWGEVKPTELWTAANGTLTLLVLIIGAVAGYVRFIRRREMHSSCSLRLEAKFVPIAEGYALKVVATVLNAGSYQLVFSEGSQQNVDVRSADRMMWDDVLLHGGQMIWSMGDSQKQALLEAEGKRQPPDHLEPGQQLERTLLFPVSADEPAFNIRLYVEACPRWIVKDRDMQGWSTEVILTAKEALAQTGEPKNGR